MTATLATAPVPLQRHRAPNPAPLVVVVHPPGELLGGQDARLVWGRHWYGATLGMAGHLDERQRLEALRWAVDLLLEHVTPDGYEDGGAEDWYAEGVTQ